jgi:hypothetical protein
MSNCKLTCANGFKLDENRCPMCECVQHTVENCQFSCPNGQKFMPLNNRLCKCIHNCPSLTQCYKNCDLEIDSHGCQICSCKEFKHHHQQQQQHNNHKNNRNSNCIIEESGQRVKNGETWTNDGCHECICDNGKELCTLITCPMFDCERTVLNKTINRCCPICEDKVSLNENHQINSRERVVETRLPCESPILKNYYYENDTFEFDKCTTCTCKNNFLYCEHKNCPLLTCSNPVVETSECCPICSSNSDKIIEIDIQISPSSSSNLKNHWTCVDFHDGIKYHGSSWKENDCVHCACTNGERKCFDHALKCPKLNCDQQVFLKGECCPQCLDKQPTKRN